MRSGRSRVRSRETTRWARLSSLTRSSPMCERSKSPTASRTARCSSRMLLYWRGMTQPPKLVIWAPKRTCSSCSGVRSAVTTKRYASPALLFLVVVLIVKIVEVVEQLLVVPCLRFAQQGENGGDPRLLPLQQLGQLGGGGRTVQPLREQALRRLQQATGDDEGFVVALGLVRLGKDIVHGHGDHVNQAGMKAPIGRLVMLDGRDQPHGAFLEEVAKGHAPALPGLRGLQHQVQVVLDQDAICRIAIGSVGCQEPALVLGGEAWVARELLLDLVLVVPRGSLLDTLGHGLILRMTGPGTGPMITT